MVATFTLMDVFEDRLALLWLYAVLVDTSDATPDQLYVDYGIGCRPVLYLPSQGFINWQFFAHQELEDGLCP